MKKNISSKTQDADHSKGQEGNAPTGKKGKTNNSQPMNNSMRESEEQKAGRTKEQQNENDYRQKDSHNQQEETNY